MLFKDVALIDENMKLREHCWLGTIGDKIEYIGDLMPDDPQKYGRLYSKSRGKLLIPGFVNAHSHAGMYMLRGYAENMRLMDWLTKRIFPFEAQLRPEDVYWSTLMSIAEMLRFGIVATTEMYMPGAALCEAFAEGGVRANISGHFVCFGNEHYDELPIARENREMFTKYNNYDNGRIKTEFCVHSEYTTTQRVVSELAAEAKAMGGAVHVHISETADEVEQCRARHKGRSPVEYMEECGIFELPVNAAHCVHLSDSDIELLAAHKVNVASCPKSNLKLASGVCPAVKLMKAGINVALGTDSVASNNNLNMLEELKFFALLHKGVNGDPTLITPGEALYAATRAGAIAQRRKDCGLLKEGFKADIVAIDVDKVYMKPAHSLLNNLIYSALGSDVFMTLVNGEVLYEDGEYKKLDVEKIAKKCEASQQRILEELAATGK